MIINNHTILHNLPKVELHLHLDCSLSFDVVSTIDPAISRNEYHSNYIAPPKCKNLADFLKRTPSGIRLMQTRPHLELVVRDLFQQLKDENVIYAEIRFAPLLHLAKGLVPEEVVEVVAATTARCIDATGIKAGIILCTLRHFTEAQSLQTVRLVKKYIATTPVVGLDLAANEAGFPIDAHTPAFQYAIQHDLPRTAHAGEARGPESIRETLEHFKPARIGHGVRSIEDPKLVEYLAQHDLHLEVCPTCNIQIDVYEKYSDHPIDRLYQAGVSVGINTDARTLSDITLTGEYQKLVQEFGWGIEHFRRCNLNALAHAFLSEFDKENLKNVIKAEYEKVMGASGYKV